MRVRILLQIIGDGGALGSVGEVAASAPAVRFLAHHLFRHGAEAVALLSILA